MSKVENAISWMERAANDSSHGYDQIYRWGEKGDYDCSSSVITAYEQAGIPLKSNGATYTGNMYSAAIKSGFTDVTSSVNLATGSGLIRGDILLNEAHHVAMYCGNGMEVEASINEKGGARGGQPGDQTGREFLIRPYRHYPWNKVLRYVEKVTEKETVYGKKFKVFKDNGKSLNVFKSAKDESDKVGAIPNGKVVKAIDKKGNWYKISYDKLTGWVRGKHLMEVVKVPALASVPPVLKKGGKGEQVSLLQQDLNYVMKTNLTVDGDFGICTFNILVLFQKRNGLVADGIYGIKSKDKMKTLLK